ncbi:hypothetical protein [Kitasatospora sp. NPDC059571]|uniref:hypothetical protein n=1 Tax=Kitasatospora sp. NPDC059571 TaxID=3346871 RepID=UPI0036810EBD
MTAHPGRAARTDTWPTGRALGVLAAGTATQVALYPLWSALPGPAGAFASSPVGVLMWWLSLWLGPMADFAVTRRWIRAGGPLGPLRVTLWTLRAVAVGTVAWIAAAVVLLVLAMVAL